MNSTFLLGWVHTWYITAQRWRTLVWEKQQGSCYSVAAHYIEFAHVLILH